MLLKCGFLHSFISRHSKFGIHMKIFYFTPPPQGVIELSWQKWYGVQCSIRKRGSSKTILYISIIYYHSIYTCFYFNIWAIYNILVRIGSASVLGQWSTFKVDRTNINVPEYTIMKPKCSIGRTFKYYDRIHKYRSEQSTDFCGRSQNRNDRLNEHSSIFATTS